MIRLNLGSGQRPFGEDWINVDVRKQGYQVDILSDIGDLPMFKDESVDLICLHHVVEHIDIGELEKYISEWYRILKPGGEIAVFVPDITKIFLKWSQGKISTYIRNVNIYGAYQGFFGDLHRWGYDHVELLSRMSALNEQTGEVKFKWSTVKVFDPELLKTDLYKGADIAIDWWILGLVFKK